MDCQIAYGSELKRRLKGSTVYTQSRGQIEMSAVEGLRRITKCAQELRDQPQFVVLLALCVESRKIWMRLLVIAFTPHCQGNREKWLLQFIRALEFEEDCETRIDKSLAGMSAYQTLAKKYFENLRWRKDTAESLLNIKTDGLWAGLKIDKMVGEELVSIVAPDSNLPLPVESDYAMAVITGAWWVLFHSLAVLEAELAHEAGPFPACLEQHADLALISCSLFQALLDHASTSTDSKVVEMISLAKTEEGKFTKLVVDRLLEQVSHYAANHHTPEVFPNDFSYKGQLTPILEAVKQFKQRSHDLLLDAKKKTNAYVWNEWLALIMWQGLQREAMDALAGSEISAEQRLLNTLSKIQNDHNWGILRPITQDELDGYNRLLAELVEGKIDIRKIPQNDNFECVVSADDAVLSLLAVISINRLDWIMRWMDQLFLAPPKTLNTDFPLRLSGFLLRVSHETENRKFRSSIQEKVYVIIEKLTGVGDPKIYGDSYSFAALLASLFPLACYSMADTVPATTRCSSLLKKCLGCTHLDWESQKYFIQFLVDDISESLDNGSRHPFEVPVPAARILRSIAVDYSVIFPQLPAPLEAVFSVKVLA